MIFQLPAPPSPNKWPKSPYGLHVAKNEYRRRAWAAAVQQHKPDRDPPALVTVHVLFLIRSRRYFLDDSNREAALKWLLDTLGQRQTGKLDWRLGLYDLCGYYVDDDPAHLRLGDCWQEKCASRELECVVVEIAPGPPGRTAIAKTGPSR